MKSSTASRSHLGRCSLLVTFALASLAACGGGGGGGGGGEAAQVRVNDIDPGTGPFIGGTDVVIHGTNFQVGEDNVV